ncbi:pseudaminic acid synthase [Flocculibacter collagenilyticus]|uniref:pseudaminic acid synthase n=1 Tax=Flocculibacter collagenilyticus TaxID=2744479 RepID=UPI0018F710EB|nr:pseudaminic acid synthase [Flocculibacter collagenilyticus]
MFKINNRIIDSHHSPYVIAEMSGNHNGDINRAIELIKTAKACGADAVKLQTYTADTITLKSDKPDFRISEGLWQGHTLHDLYEWAHTPWEWHKTLFEKAKELNITIFSSPFDFTAVDFLEELNAPAYKIASFEVIDTPLIEYVAKTGKPMIMSTGMATKEEIAEALAVAHSTGNKQIALLHCISGYPTPVSQANLRTLLDLAESFNVPVGLSDHTMGTVAATASVALGATIVEKHFTLSREDGGPDAAFSLEPSELKQLCENVQQSWQALGIAGYECKPAEQQNLQFRRSLYVTKSVKKGELFTLDNVKSVRPGYGLAPKHLYDVLGKAAKVDIDAVTALTDNLVSNFESNK